MPEEAPRDRGEKVGPDDSPTVVVPPPLPAEIDMPSRAEVERVLRDKVASLLALDGGIVALRSIDLVERTLVLVYSGACAGCPGLDITHGRIVAPILQRAFPGVRLVTSAIPGEYPSVDP